MSQRTEGRITAIFWSESARWVLNIAVAVLLGIVSFVVKEMRATDATLLARLNELALSDQSQATSDSVKEMELRLMQVIATLPPSDWKQRIIALETRVDDNGKVLQQIAQSQARIETAIQMHLEQTAKPKP